jgi:DNA-directed RNA polymerase specialized sigma24 family protein
MRDYSLKELAKELEITEASAKSRLHRARAQLSSRAPKNLTTQRLSYHSSSPALNES